MDLQALRKEIDELDDALIPLLLRRLDVTRAAAAYKAENGLPIYDAQREQVILEKAAEKSGEHAAAVQSIVAAILEASREEQQRWMNGEKR